MRTNRQLVNSPWRTDQGAGLNLPDPAPPPRPFGSAGSPLPRRSPFARSLRLINEGYKAVHLGKTRGKQRGTEKGISDALGCP